MNSSVRCGLRFMCRICHLRAKVGAVLIALITTVGILPNKMDQALRIIHTSIKPLVEQTEGNHGLFIMANRERGELVSITLWESERALEAIERSGFADQQDGKLSTVIAEAITGVTYEVVEAPAPLL
jgi:hypothetical protein